MKTEYLLHFPSNYSELDKETMRQINGGGINLGMTKGYLNKNICIDTAKWITRTKGWKKVTIMQLAREIYGHAFVFYKLKVLKYSKTLKKRLYDHCADGVNVENKVDKYQAAWNKIWTGIFF